MDLLQQLREKINIDRVCKSIYGLHLQKVWLSCDFYGKEKLNWSFEKRRQCFFEVIAYYMEQKKIKFGGRIDFTEEQFNWNESTNIENTIKYLEKGFSKNEDVFINGKLIMPELYGNIEINSKEGFKKVVNYPSENYQINMYIYFFSYCPTIAYWHEGTGSWVWSS